MPSGPAQGDLRRIITSNLRNGGVRKHADVIRLAAQVILVARQIRCRRSRELRVGATADADDGFDVGFEEVDGAKSVNVVHGIAIPLCEGRA